MSSFKNNFKKILSMLANDQLAKNMIARGNWNW
jgi:hypothetical protein